MTIMIYLNDDFEEGSTNFLWSYTGGRKDETIAAELSRGYDTVYRLKPKTGTSFGFVAAWRSPAEIITTHRLS
jgi:hypothetical protein